MDFHEVQRVLASFEQEGVEYAIFGAMAMNLQGLVRATEDVDLFVKPEAANIERLKKALHAVYGDPDIEQIDAGEMLGDYPAVKYYPPNSSLSFDILTRLGEMFFWENLETVQVESGGIKVRVISPRMIVRMKGDTVRAKDRQDAAWVREAFGLED